MNLKIKKNNTSTLLKSVFALFAIAICQVAGAQTNAFHSILINYQPHNEDARKNVTYLSTDPQPTLTRKANTHVSFTVYAASGLSGYNAEYGYVHAANANNKLYGPSTTGYYYFFQAIKASDADTQVAVSVDPLGRSGYIRSNYLFNVVTAPTQEPDLVVTSMTVNGYSSASSLPNLNVGDEIEVSCFVRNNGGSIDSSFYVDFFLSTNQTPQGSYKRGITIQSMSAGQQLPVTFPKYTIQSQDVNAKYVVVAADSTNRIQESNESNNTQAWGQFSITAPLTPPTNPSPRNGLSGVSRSGTFSWTGDSNSDSYDVYLGQTSNISQMSFLGNTANSNMTYNSLLPGVIYYWVVKAKNAHEEVFSDVWSFTTIDDRQPLAFSSVGAPQTPDGLLWASSSDVFTHGVTNGRAAATSSQPLSQTISGSTGEGLRVEATAVVAGAGWGTAADYSTNSIRMPFVATGSGLYNVNGQLLSEQVARSLGYAFTGMSRPSYELKNRIRILDENQEYVSGRLLLNHQNIANFAEAVEEFQLALYTTALNQVLTFGMGHAVQMVGEVIAEAAMFTKGFVDNTYADPDLERQSTHHVDFNVYLESGKTYYLELSTESFVYAQTFSLNSLQYTNLLSNLKVGDIAISPVMSGSVISPSTPTNIDISNSSVIVNMPVGSRIGDLFVTDERGNDHVLSLVSGTGSTNNDEFVISGYALFTSKELVSEGSRTVRVRAMNEFGNSFEKAFQITVVANPVLPPNVTSHPLSSSVIVGDFITFTTSANGGGDLGYLWEYSEDIGVSWTATSWSNSNSILVGPTAQSWSGRWYRCVIVNESGSAITNHAELTVLPTPPPEPTIGTPTNVGQTSFTANWSASIGATGYRLDVSTNSNFSSFVSSYQNSDVGNVTSRNVTGLAAATTYYYRVRAYNSGDTSDNSSSGQVETLPQPDVLPTLTTTPATNITHNSATTGGIVTSAGSGTVTARGVVYSNFPDPHLGFGINPGIQIPSGSGTGSFTINLSGLNPSNTYYVRAYATNSFGTAYGSQISFTTLPQITSHPQNRTVTAPEHASFSVSASGSTPLSYQWQVSTNGGLTWSNLIGETSSTYNTGSTTTSMSNNRYRCVVSNSADSVTSNSAILTVTEVSIPSFEDWINHPDVPLDRRAPRDSAAGDGVANIVKYFQGIDPMDTRGLAGLKQVERHSPNEMRAWFLRSKVGADSFTGSVRWSRDLVNWHHSGASDGGSTVTLDMSHAEPDKTASNREWVRVDATMTGATPGALFLRLEVDAPGLLNDQVMLRKDGMVFSITDGIYPDQSDWDEAVAAEFGPGWQVADWETLKTAFGSTNDESLKLANFLKEQANGSAYLKVGGSRFWPASPSRYYFMSAHFGNKPGSYLDHDQIQGNIVSLGSWWGSNRIFVMKSEQEDPDQPNGVMSVTGGSLNGMDLSTGQREIIVAPGAQMSGSVIIRLLDQYCAGCIVPIGYTWTWGSRQASIQSLGFSSRGTNDRTANINLTAPTEPGTYYIHFAAAAVYNISQVMSQTSRVDGTSVWNDGNDIWDLSSQKISFAGANGYVQNWQSLADWAGNTMVTSNHLALNSIRIVVE